MTLLLPVNFSIDLDIDVENLPPPEVKFDPERGVKIVTQYYGDENGNLIREIKESKIEKRLVASQIAERKKWQKYGDAKNDPPGGNSANTYPGDVVTMQLVQTRQVTSFWFFLLFAHHLIIMVLTLFSHSSKTFVIDDNEI